MTCPSFWPSPCRSLKAVLKLLTMKQTFYWHSSLLHGTAHCKKKKGKVATKKSLIKITLVKYVIMVCQKRSTRRVLTFKHAEISIRGINFRQPSWRGKKVKMQIVVLYLKAQLKASDLNPSNKIWQGFEFKLISYKQIPHFLFTCLLTYSSGPVFIYLLYVV